MEIEKEKVVLELFDKVLEKYSDLLITYRLWAK
jgi:hypothetical protein